MKNIRTFYQKMFLMVKFTIYLNRRVFVMVGKLLIIHDNLFPKSQTNTSHCSPVKNKGIHIPATVNRRLTDIYPVLSKGNISNACLHCVIS